MKKLTNLTKLFSGMMLATAVLILAGCKDTKPSPAKGDSPAAEAAPNDSTIYGTCGENTAMSSLELITDAGDTLRFLIEDDQDDVQRVQGGMMPGDRVAVLGGPTIDGERYADKVINLTSLQGKWTSLDKNFEIEEGGTVKSNVKAENNPWTSWKILNGQLLLNVDTFRINSISQDSLTIESNEGIFVYKRIL